MTLISLQLTIRQKEVFGCLQTAHAQDFFSSYLNRWLCPNRVSYYIRKYRTMIHLFPVDEACHVCRKVCLG
jgi:hypothetical protein